MSGWGVLAQRGLDQLSPPEVEHTLLELPTNRGEYVGVISELSGWPERSPIGRRVPTPADIAQLDGKSGRWRAVALLDDLPALSQTALLFHCSFALDPMYDSGDLLYGAWHDPAIKAEHARRLAQHGRWMAHLAPLLADGSVVLAPDHLPGSWDPRPSWRAPRPDAAPHLHQTWALRTLLTLLYWADRLDAVVCTSQPEIVASLPLALELHAVQRVALATVTDPQQPTWSESGRRPMSRTCGPQRARRHPTPRGGATARPGVRARARPRDAARGAGTGVDAGPGRRRLARRPGASCCDAC